MSADQSPRAGDGSLPALPDGWTTLRMERVPGHPETVAYGPAEDMERLRKTLDGLYAERQAAQYRASLPVVEAGAIGAAAAQAPATVAQTEGGQS